MLIINRPNNGLDINSLDANFGALAGSGSFNLGSQTVTVGSRNTASTYSGTVNGTGNLVKVGTANWTLSGDNNFTGSLTIQNGPVTIGSDNALINNTVILAPSGPLATLSLGGANRTIGGLAGSGLVTIDHNLTVGNNNANLTFTGLLSGTGSQIKIGSGTQTLSGNNTFSGGIMLNGGTLGLAHNNAAGTGTITVLGSTIDYANGTDIANAMQLQNNVTLNVDTGAATHSGNISETGGSFAVDKAGAGTLTLSGNNTFTGGVNHLAGMIRLGSNTAAGTGAINVNGGTVVEVASVVNTSNSILLNNNIELSASGGVATYSGNLSGDVGEHAVDKTGAGTLEVTGSLTVDQLLASEGSLNLDGATVDIVPDVFNALFVRQGAQANVLGGTQVTVGGGTASSPRVVVFHDGSALSISGAGTQVQSSFFDVAPSGGGNPMANIQNNAQVIVSGRFSVGDLGTDEGGDGVVNVTNGASVTAGNTTLFRRGTLNIDGGSVTTNILIRTDGVSQTLLISDPAGGHALTIGGISSNSTYDGRRRRPGIDPQGGDRQRRRCRHHRHQRDTRPGRFAGTALGGQRRARSRLDSCHRIGRKRWRSGNRL